MLAMNRSVLVVDDNEMNRDLLSRRMEQEGRDKALPVAINRAQRLVHIGQRNR